MAKRRQDETRRFVVLRVTDHPDYNLYVVNERDDNGIHTPLLPGLVSAGRADQIAQILNDDFTDTRRLA